MKNKDQNLLEEIAAINAVHALANNLGPVIVTRLRAGFLNKEIRNESGTPKAAFANAFPEVGEGETYNMWWNTDRSGLYLRIEARAMMPQSYLTAAKEVYIFFGRILDNKLITVPDYEFLKQDYELESLKKEIAKVIQADQAARALRSALPDLTQKEFLGRYMD